ncbi:DUF551 domain-containing protein [Klebsiella pneumoniae]|uniref:DUF551 domain-containing protein n=1 Tax=Klebsiella pneumoniae TaxID=573 RepID=UPI001F5F1732|nr:DUF551 domain-containing protein [Klebsiella pneumoniae]
MTSKLTRERIELIANFHRVMALPTSHAEIEELARMALAAMEGESHTDDELSNLLWYSQEATCHSDPNYSCEFQRLATPGLVAGIILELQERRKAAMDGESVELPLDYLQGHKDGLEWAAQLAEANHPEKGDWLYDDPIELAKAIRKGPDMPPAQPVADSEPVIVVGDDGGDALSYRRLIQSFEPGTKLYLHAQPAPVVSGWIPVSERLPEEGGRYWCYVEEQNSLGKSHYQWNCSWNEGAWSDKALTGRVTHWMPLPAAPQEVKDGK